MGMFGSFTKLPSWAGGDKMPWASGGGTGDYAGDTGAIMAGVGAGLLTGNPMVGLGVYSGMSSAAAAREANANNLAMQRETNATLIELANTAHQREVADLQKAGLNPILSSKYGGASTPGLTAPSVESIAPVIQNSANQVATAYLNMQNLKADIALKQSAMLNNSATAIKTQAETDRVKMENEVTSANLPIKKYEAEYREKRNPWWKNMGINLGDTFGNFGKVFGANANVSNSSSTIFK